MIRFGEILFFLKRHVKVSLFLFTFVIQITCEVACNQNLAILKTVLKRPEKGTSV